MSWGSDRLLKARLREEFLITCHDGSGWQGLLYAVDDRTVVLVRAQRLAEGAAPGAATPVDGELLLARSEIAYMQRP